MTDFVEKAVNFCKENKLRLSESRISVLKIINSSEKPIKAYEILAKLSKICKNPKPPTAYRAIDFWTKHNFIHRIESLNAYAVCKAQHLHSGSQFMICDNCGLVIESYFGDLPAIFKKAIKKKTFTLSKWNLEIKGSCGKCS